MHPPARALVAVVALAVAAGLAACGQAAPTTYPASAGPLPTGLIPTPVGGGTPPPEGGVEAAVSAEDVAFSPDHLSLPAGVPIVLTFRNRDEGVPHDLRVVDPSGNVVARTEIITGLSQAQLNLGPLAVGTYTFNCDVHPNMTGVIAVGAQPDRGASAAPSEP